MDELDSPPSTEAPKPRGLQLLPAEARRRIASMGGRTAHERGTAHEFNAEKARAAGRLGGEKVAANREHMKAIGRNGGLARWKKAGAA